jgi:hypothetical protein
MRRRLAWGGRIITCGMLPKLDPPMRCHSVGCGMRSRMPSQCNRIRKVYRSRSHRAVIRAYDEAGNVIETHERGEFIGEAPRLCPAP